MLNLAKILNLDPARIKKVSKNNELIKVRVDPFIVYDLVRNFGATKLEHNVVQIREDAYLNYDRGRPDFEPPF